MSILDEKNLPSYESFYSKLNETNVSKEKYNYALNVFKCETIGDY